MPKRTSISNDVRRWLTAAALAVSVPLPAVAVEAEGDTDAAATSPGTAPQESGADEEQEREWYLRFDALEQYRVSFATAPKFDGTIPAAAGDTDGAPGAENDHDLRLSLSGTLTESEDHFLADVAMGMWADLDGDDPSFHSPYDESQTYGTSLWIDLYSLYGEYHSDGVFSLARVGRQVSEHGPLVTFDGGALELSIAKPYLDLFAFGGRSVHFFEADGDFFEDWIASGGFTVRPTRSLRLELDYRFTKEDLTPIDGVEARTAEIDHGYGLAAWFRHKDWLYLKAYFRGIDEKAGLTGGAVSLESRKLELGTDIKVDAQLVTLDEINERQDPFHSVLGESRPHIKINADLWKAFTTKAGTYTVHGGWDGRLLLGDPATAFNRDYGRAYLWLQAVDIGIRGPFAGVIGEFHYTHASSGLDSENAFSVGGSAGWDREPLRFEAGTFYQRFKYDYYEDVQEKSSVRTYFADVSYRPLRWLSGAVRYEVESYDRQVHTIMLTLTQRY